MSEKQHPEANGNIKIPSKWLWPLIAAALGYAPLRDTITGYLPERGAKAALEVSSRGEERNREILRKLEELDNKLGTVDGHLAHLDQRVDALYEKSK